MTSPLNDLWISNSSTGVTFNSSLVVDRVRFFNTGGIINANKLTIGSGGSSAQVLQYGQTGGTKTVGNFDVAPSFNIGSSGYYMYYSQEPSARTTGVEIPPSRALYNCQIDNTNGLTISGGDLTVTNTFTMANGNITTGVNTLTLGSNVSNLGTLTRTNGIIVGKFARWFAAGTSISRLFPVGSSTYYRPVDLSFTNATTSGGTITVEHLPSNPGIHNTSSLDDNGYTIDAYSQVGYWKINTGDGLAGGVYSLNLTMAGIVGVNDYTKLHIIKRSLSSDPWAANGTFVSGTGTNSVPICSRTNMSGFSEFGIGSNSTNNPLDAPLPVQLSSFSFSLNGRDVGLNWKTDKEINNAGFDVERAEVRSQNSEYRKIGYVKGNGSTNSPVIYTFEDKKLNSGKYNYRLKQIDYNGNFEYFELDGEVEVGLPIKFNLSQNYPNPFNPTTKIDFDLPFDSKVNIILYDITGREMKTLVNEGKTAGYYTVQFNASDLSSGTYFYRIMTKSADKDFVATKKMVLIK